MADNNDNIKSLELLIAKASPDSKIMLPKGEFKGPLTISKPLKIIGENTTVWTDKAPAVIIKSTGVSLSAMRIEVTDGRPENAALCSLFPCEINDVEISGAVSGFGSEDGFFGVPRTIDLGDFQAEEENTFLTTVVVPERTEIKAENITFEPSVLSKGKNELLIKVSGIPHGTCLYSEVLFKSKFIRRAYICGKALSNAEKADRKRIDCENCHSADIIKSAELSLPSENSMREALILTRGMRVPLAKYSDMKFSVFFSCKDMPDNLDIDPYVFLLGENGKALSDKSLIFFGNERSKNGEAVYFPKDGHVEIDLSKADAKIKRVVLVYSVYAGNNARNFSKVRDPRVSLWTDRERVSFVMNDVCEVTSAVALEFYVYKDEWKISAVGAGFKEGMARFCRELGIQVDE